MIQLDNFFYFVGASSALFFLILNHLNFNWNYLLIIFIGVFFSKILFVFLNPNESFTSLNGGFVFYGFVIPLLVSKFFFFKKEFFNINISKIVIAICFSHSVGRIGCYFSNCCFGHFFSIPVQLIEATYLCCLGFYLLQKFKKKSTDLCFIYFINYSVFRFFIEYSRQDSARGFYLNLSTSQWISVMIFFLIFVQKKFFEQKFQERIALI